MVEEDPEHLPTRSRHFLVYGRKPGESFEYYYVNDSVRVRKHVTADRARIKRRILQGKAEELEEWGLSTFSSLLEYDDLHEVPRPAFF